MATQKIQSMLTAQAMSSGFSIIWGAWAAWPYTDMFAMNPSLYRPMMDLVPSEAFWGGLILSFGISAIVLLVYGRKGLAALLLGIIFSFFGTMYWQGDFVSPGGALYTFLGVFHLVYFVAGTRWFR